MFSLFPPLQIANNTKASIMRSHLNLEQNACEYFVQLSLVRHVLNSRFMNARLGNN